MSTQNIALNEECIQKYNQVYKEKNNQAYALILALIWAIQQSKENTWKAFNEELNACSKSLLMAIEAEQTEHKTVLSLRALAHIFYRMTQKVDYEKSIQEIKLSI